MEACFYSMMCRNRDELWALEAGQEWRCEMDWAGFARLALLILKALDPDEEAAAKEAP